MRQVLSLSLPAQITGQIKKNAKDKGFPSVSAYIKFLFEQDRDLISEDELLDSVREARSDYKKGRTTKAASLADLI